MLLRDTSTNINTIVRLYKTLDNNSNHCDPHHDNNISEIDLYKYSGRPGPKNRFNDRHYDNPLSI